MTESTSVTVAGLNVSRETFAALGALEALVRRWNPTINLVSKSTLPDLWQRHIVDSAQVFGLCPSTARLWADIGSGGGFPGLVIAILARESLPDLRVILVESDLRKATFLRQAAKSLGLSVAVQADRIESLPPLEADVLSARALAPLSDLLAFADLHLRRDGLAVFPKGARHADEIAEARKTWDFDVKTHPSLAEPGAAILMIRKINRAEKS
jgi:16S rRNA (guanine527-N7)-methyltransferase